MKNTKNTARVFAYIHGFNSDKNSRSYRDIKMLLGTSYDVYDFYYNYRQEAKYAYAEIEEKLLAVYTKNPKLTLIGSSLGGFFTLLFAGKYALPCVAFNPVTYPHVQLAPFTAKTTISIPMRNGILRRNCSCPIRNFL